MLNECGVTVLCLDLMSPGVDEAVVLAAVKLCVGLLFKEGGATTVQTTMYKHLSSTDSTQFFKQCAETIQKLISWHRFTLGKAAGMSNNPAMQLETPPEEETEGTEMLTELPESIILIRFLQLMCEGQPHASPSESDIDPGWSLSIVLTGWEWICYLAGHYLPNQDLMREQPHNRESVNLLDDLVEYLGLVTKMPCKVSSDAAQATSATILEFIQVSLVSG